MGNKNDITDKKPVGVGRAAEAVQYGPTTATDRQSVVREVCTVWRPMNKHGAVTLREMTGHRTFQVVEYATPAIKTVLDRTQGEAEVCVQLVSLTARGNNWRAVGIIANP